MWTKICANTNVDDARLAAKLGADAVGFVFAPSKRQVTPDEAAEMVARLPAGVEKVGVFATDDPYKVQHGVDVAGLTAVQLHGAYRAEMVQHLVEECGDGLKIIQTMAYELDPVDRQDHDARFEGALRLVFGDKRVWAVLLDAKKAGASGGLGLSFDWERVGKIVRRTRMAFGDDAPKVILAGGLRAENVAEAIAAVEPWGVDVASGVEAEPGKKDPARLKAFLETSKGNGAA
ncbi:phosphoribosylanthranilate isomerase [Granulicella sp. 5B5]|uniref:phosphoribosylanthranilate isomerase n=1 Tax=Granulicella sp. 5B5 TaxID=1617967 RepID=UPI0015F40BFB|nr:phosphoribosylanthranilate isomerase [Granulicella sp. 5B5]QMV18545.1 phosphoribosylanthranilate isomerase [Granulicella sp. 5B5]